MNLRNQKLLDFISMVTAEQINKHIGKFTDIFVNGKTKNEMPIGVKLTVWCDNGDDEQGFLYDLEVKDLGLQALIARKWILQSELKSLLDAVA